MIRAVSYAEILGAPNAKDLLAAYGAECSIPEIGEVNPQAEIYAQMEKSGQFQVFGAFEDELIGFASVLCSTLPHYGKKIGIVESIFLLPSKRSSKTGNGLMNAIENWAKEKNCEVILYNARTGSQFEKLLLMLTPYQRTNSVFLRRLHT